MPPNTDDMPQVALLRILLGWARPGSRPDAAEGANGGVTFENWEIWASLNAPSQKGGEFRLKVACAAGSRAAAFLAIVLVETGGVE